MPNCEVAIREICRKSLYKTYTIMYGHDYGSYHLRFYHLIQARSNKEAVKKAIEYKDDKKKYDSEEDYDREIYQVWDGDFSKDAFRTVVWDFFE